MTDILSYKM